MKNPDVRTTSLEALDLSPQATWRDIQTKYRQLVLTLHPDVNCRRDAAERFRRVAAAYETLAVLQREERTGHAEELARLYDDPRIRRLSVEELAMRMRYSSSREVRAAVACLLGTLESRESRRILLEALRDRDVPVRRLALEALGKIGRVSDFLRCLPLVDRSLAGAYLGALRRLGCRLLRALLNTRRAPASGEGRPDT